MLEVIYTPRDPETDAVLRTRPVKRILYLLGGLSLLGLGLFLIVLFTISLVHELMTGTVFGLGICIMLIVLGALLTRDGLCQLTGLRLQFKKVE
jgi:hypothetical protein